MKMPQNIVFRLKRKNKMPQNPIIAKKTARILKFRDNFMPQKFLALNWTPTCQKIGFSCFNGRPLKMMNTAFCFILKEKRIDKKAKENLKIYGVTD